MGNTVSIGLNYVATKNVIKRYFRCFNYWLSCLLELDYLIFIEPSFNVFHATGLFCYPLKTSESNRFSDIFGRV